ncbi:kunitz trypsin inhibitor 2-like [Papaver somniferum]|uniref:kunitz trypsin inhibitor 2-like n=1 Tax=Papaver somniferum TaxID=3469 RepID=UPI000E6F6668|nr:kunitz trypsin inhibitor 2-like [Papaver somniferum]
MKTTTASLLLTFAFISLATCVQFSAVSATSEAVRDIKGQALRKGTKYYILPVARGRGGGLVLGKQLNGTQCPLQVVQAKREISKGFPLTFTSVNPKAKFIRVSTDLNVKFSASSICIQSMVWRLADFDESVSKWFIATDGVSGKPGPQTTGNWFKIEKDGVIKNTYKLVHCPGVCNFCKVICKEVGIYIGADRVRRLALINDGERPFRVMFKKA